MTTPTFGQWRSSSVNDPVTKLQSQTIRGRFMAALAALASGQNPDGTVRGS